MTEEIPRLFVLRRDRDITGVSGPGDVADGVQWADGSVVIRWRARPSTAVWDNLDTMLSVHGHDGATRVVWADEDQARAKFGADIAEIYDVPASMLGPEAERAYLQRQIETALVNASQSATWAPEGRPEWGQISSRLSRFVNAVMPIVSQVLEQRDRARTAAGRAYQLADRWEASHGAAMFLVRAAGAELRDVLDDEAASPSDAAVCEECLSGVHGPNHHRRHLPLAADGFKKDQDSADDRPTWKRVVTAHHAVARARKVCAEVMSTVKRDSNNHPLTGYDRGLVHAVDRVATALETEA